MNTQDKTAITDSLVASVKPCFETRDNPLLSEKTFRAYEIQTAQLMASPDGETQFFEAVTDEYLLNHPNAIGPLVYAVYGRKHDGTVEHLFDRMSLKSARESVTLIIG